MRFTFRKLAINLTLFALLFLGLSVKARAATRLSDLTPGFCILHSNNSEPLRLGNHLKGSEMKLGAYLPAAGLPSKQVSNLLLILSGAMSLLGFCCFIKLS